MVGEEMAANEHRKTWDERRHTEAQWYIVEAVEGEDFEVCRALSKHYECFRPVDRVIVTRRVKVGGVVKPQKVERKIPRFGRYVFIRMVMNSDRLSSIKQSPEVRGFVCMAGTEEPASIPDALIEFYRKGVEGAAKEIDGWFLPSDKVRISIGPATGVVGVVKSVSNLAARLESRDRQWSGPLLVPLAHLELIEKGVGRVADARKPTATHVSDGVVHRCARRRTRR